VLIGSHAPFTPLPTVVEAWDSIGDGAVFGQLPRSGGNAFTLWRDPPALRLAYADAVDVVLRSIALYAQRPVNRPTMLIVLGDHEPAAIVTGDEAARTVPMHVIARNPELLRPFLDWGFLRGLRPAADAPVRPMEEVRALLVTRFSQPPAAIEHLAGEGAGKPG
jgi:hypothetical protein